MMIRFELSNQFVRYILVGLTSNLVGYSLYLLFVSLLGKPKTIVTVMYAVTVALSFWGNRRVTFSDNGKLLNSAIRYLSAHLIGYTINILLLILMVDKLGYRAQLAQGIAMIAVSIVLFVTFQIFVFREQNFVKQ